MYPLRAIFEPLDPAWLALDSEDERGGVSSANYACSSELTSLQVGVVLGVGWGGVLGCGAGGGVLAAIRALSTRR